MKSHESDQVELLQHIYTDACNKCITGEPDVRDLMTIKSRVEHEGLSFVTITLPSFGSDVETALAQGEVTSNLFRSFKRPGKQAIPAFLQGMLRCLFNEVTGRILDEPDIIALEGIRQIAYTFKKVKDECTPTRVRKAFVKFIQDEQSLQRPIMPLDTDSFRAVSHVLWDGHFEDFNPLNAIPKHGPGATEDRTYGNSKFRTSAWHDRLEPYFPLLSHKFSSESAWNSKEFKDVTIVDEDSEPPVRVITVPKTLKTPRIIAIEPVCMQYTQQAIKAYLYERLEKFELTAGHINFTDQSVNRSLALQSSRDQSFATLDLSSASDRVPLSLVEVMLDGNKCLLESILACRSKKAKLPDGTIVHLEKFASMGSALCFPIESMYFYTLCVMALLEYHSLPVDYVSIRKVTKVIYVYGDDIIVPVDTVKAVTDHLQKYYCKVNTAKSFWSGSFRESCGMDAFNGEEVTPTYVRYHAPCNRRSTNELISWVETSNLFYKRGYWRTAQHMKHCVERILGPLPIMRDATPGLGWFSFGSKPTCERFHRELHRPEVRTWVPRPIYRPDRLEGYSALTKCLLRLESGSFSTIAEVDSRHLERTARCGAVALQRRWVPTL